LNAARYVALVALQTPPTVVQFDAAAVELEGVSDVDVVLVLVDSGDPDAVMKQLMPNCWHNTESMLGVVSGVPEVVGHPVKPGEAAHMSGVGSSG
jgi:hypothetical protein